MYRNIKHAFFQPAEKDGMITLLHLHLLNPIMVGNKKTKDIQVGGMHTSSMNLGTYKCNPSFNHNLRKCRFSMVQRQRPCWAGEGSGWFYINPEMSLNYHCVITHSLRYTRR